MNEFDITIQILSETNKLTEPNYINILNYKSLCLNYLNQNDNALITLNQVLKINPNQIDALINISKILLLSNLNDDSLK